MPFLVVVKPFAALSPPKALAASIATLKLATVILTKSVKARADSLSICGIYSLFFLTVLARLVGSGVSIRIKGQLNIKMTYRTVTISSRSLISYRAS